MIDLELVAVFDGEKIPLDDVKVSDFVALERHFQLSLPTLGGQLKFEHMCFLAWRVLRRKRGDIAEYGDEFLERIDDITPVAAPFVPDDDLSRGS